MGKNIVLYVGSMIMPDKNAAAQRAMAICKSLRDMGHRPAVVGLSEEIQNSVGVIDTLCVYNGFDCYAVKYPQTVAEWFNRMWTIKPFVKVMKHYGIENIHSIIAMDYEVMALSRLKRFCEGYDIHLIADSVEWYAKSKLPFPMNIGKDVDTKLRMEWLYPRFDNMICISSYLYDHYKDKVQNLVLIPGTVDMSDEKWAKVKPYSGNVVLTIGYAGHPGLECDKERVDWLIQAISELNQEGKPCRLIMAGFDKSVIDNFSPELCELPYYRTNIQYLGKISHIECLNMIASCDFSAIVREDKRVTKAGFPTKLSESFACKTPVITTPSSNIADYVKDGVNGFVTQAFDFGCLKATLEKAMALNDEQLAEMRIRTGIENMLTYENFTDTLRDIM